MNSRVTDFILTRNSTIVKEMNKVKYVKKIKHFTEINTRSCYKHGFPGFK